MASLTERKRFLPAAMFAVVVLIGAVACGSDADKSADSTSLLDPADEAPTTGETTPDSTETAAEAPSPAPTQATQAVSVGHDVGDRIPDFSLRLPDATEIDSGDLLAERRPAFLYFFTTW